MTPFTSSTQRIMTSTMSLRTEQFLIDTLYEEIRIHPHKQELINLMDAQLMEDTNVYVQTHSTEYNSVM